MPVIQKKNYKYGALYHLNGSNFIKTKKLLKNFEKFQCFLGFFKDIEFMHIYTCFKILITHWSEQFDSILGLKRYEARNTIADIDINMGIF